MQQNFIMPSAAPVNHRMEGTSFYFKNENTPEQPVASNTAVEIIVNNTADVLERRMNTVGEIGVNTITDLEGNVVKPDEGLERQWWANVDELREKLEQNPGLKWRFDVEGSNKDYEGHDILNAILPKVYESATSLDNVYDEYGYTFAMMPATAWGLATVFTSSIDRSNGANTIGEPTGKIVTSSNYTHYDEDHNGFINSTSSTSLNFLTLEERDMFFTEMQKIFDQNGLKLDARKENYAFIESEIGKPNPGYSCAGGGEWIPHPGSYRWLGGGANYDLTAIFTVEKQIQENSTLKSLYDKVDKVRKGEIADDTLAQQYSIRVTDNEGNRLANDRIIVEAKNGNQIEMSVKQFSEMSRMDITKLLR
jgi:hypothetical protein